MLEIGHVPEPQQEIAEVLYEHLELSHYIDIFRSSAERVRRLVFIIAVFSVIALTALWNTTPMSWMSMRSKGLESILDKCQNQDSAIADSCVSEATKIKGETKSINKTFAELQEKFINYKEKTLEKEYFPAIPVLGLTFDINDLGVFCGVAYLLLLLLLAFSLMREHENLFLALGKVRSLHDLSKTRKDGESCANYLYHALAMSQVLNSPPTLFQWRPPRWKIVVLTTVFFIPVIVEILIILNDLLSFKSVSYLDVQLSHYMPWEVVLALPDIVLCLICIRYYRRCDHMWEGAFFHINKAFKSVGSRSLLRWGRVHKRSNDIRRQLRSQLISNFTVGEPDFVDVHSVQAEESIADGKVTDKHILSVCKKLEKSARERAHSSGIERPNIIKSAVKESRLKDDKWIVRADFKVHAQKPRQRAYFLFFRLRQVQLFQRSIVRDPRD